MMERVDLSRPGRRLEIDPEMSGVSTDIAAPGGQLQPHAGAARERAPPLGELVLGAQEEERRRIARDLHDEVNQSLTALLLRIEAAAQDAPARAAGPARRDEGSWPTRRWASCSTWPASCAPPRSTTTAWSRRCATHVRDFDRRGPGARQLLGGPPPGRAVARRAGGRLPRRTGGARERRPPLRRDPRRGQPRAARLAGAPRGRPTTARASPSPRRARASGLSGMRERALLVGGTLEIDSRPGQGHLRRARGAGGARRRRAEDGDARRSTDARPHEDPDRRRPRHRALRREAAARPPARHGGGRGGRGRRRRARAGGAPEARRRRARRLDAADDRAAGDARDQAAVAGHAGADPLHARRRALPVRGAARGRVRLRAEARGRQGPGRGRPRGEPRRAVPDLDRAAGADPRLHRPRRAAGRRAHARASRRS